MLVISDSYGFWLYEVKDARRRGAEHKQQENVIRIKFNVILRIYLVIKVKANWSELKLRK